MSLHHGFWVCKAITGGCGCRCDLMDHVKTQAPYAIFVALISVFLGDLLTNYLYPMWVRTLRDVLPITLAGPRTCA